MRKAAVLIIVLLLFLINSNVYAFTIVDDSTHGDKVSVLSNIRVEESTSGDVVTIAGNADIDNNISGDVVVVMGNVTINAIVSGDVVSVLGTVTLTDKAEVMGDLVSIGAVNKAQGAVVRGQDIIISMGSANIGSINTEFLMIVKVITLIISLLLILVLGLPVISLASQRFQNMESLIETRIGKKFAIGFLGLLGSFITMLLLSWTVLIPIAYLLLILIAKITAAIYLGKVLVKLFNANMNIYLEFVTGLITITLIKIILLILIPQEYLVPGILLDGLLNVLINSVGLGILIDSKFGKRQF